ncbi:hypothetical protein QOM21_14690 [Streptomyces sp. Pv4-95]|uniref:hypothetical protein n=1 Tax=Streptomyces sp. Pv4-95 TaxID=3049543 RepID=UPI0038923E66
MSAVSVLPATVRLPRTVAVRRALLAGLFLVGFVALGFAFGPGAHAEDRTATRDLSGASAPVEGRAVDESASLSTGAPATDETSTPARAATRDGATDRLSRSETEFAQQRETARTEVAAHKDAADGAFAEAVRPAAEQAARATEPVAAPVTDVVDELRETADPELPVQLPTCENPGRTGDVGNPGQGAPYGEQPAGSRADGASVSAAQAYADAAYGLRTAADQARPAAQEQRDQGSHGLPGQLPQGPVAPSPHTAGDGHSPRGGDQNAVSTANSPRFRLLPGGVRTADGAPTRRRAEEILEFPG